ncbi:hypothetical protein [Winogradskyella sp.]|uniref:DUF6984 family protein n=1 Tax=Winogradskyella sp. TaxID=1883156 RepID=UPI00262E2D77|nr:hypothetical protein [Winogradskyella sp.]
MARDIRKDEKEIINALLDKVSLSQLKIQESAVVEDLKDGQMGSIRFVNNNSLNRKYGKRLIEVEYVDLDNIPVYISLTLDNKDKLYELDIWKVDFNPLIKYPTPHELIFIHSTDY